MVISDPKNFVAIFFALEKAILVINFREKLRKGGGVISDLKNFVANLVLAQPVCGKNRNIFFRKRGGGGGSEAVRKFSGNSSIFEKTGFPKKYGGVPKMTNMRYDTGGAVRFFLLHIVIFLNTLITTL